MIPIKPLHNSTKPCLGMGAPANSLHTYRTPPKRTPLDSRFWREREVLKSIYKKFYIKVYENLLEWNIVYIFIKIINSQELFYVPCMKYLVNRPIFHKCYVQSTIIKPCQMSFWSTFQLTTFVGQLMILIAHAFIHK